MLVGRRYTLGFFFSLFFFIAPGGTAAAAWKKMEFFYQPPTGVRYAKNAIGALAAIELFVFVFFTFNHIQFLDVPTEFALLFLLEILHLFSWFAGLTIYLEIPSISFMRFYTLVVFLNILFDLASLIVRIILLSKCNTECKDAILFVWITTISVAVLLLLSIITIFFSSPLSALFKRWKDRVSQDVRVRAGSDVNAGFYNKAKRSLYRARTWMMTLWKLDFFTTLGIAAIFAFGLNISDTFGFLVIFQALHAFLWVGGRALAGTPDVRVSDGIFDINYVYMMLIFYAVDSLLVVASLVWRVILIIEEHKVGSGIHSDITIVFGWITIALVAILGLVSGSQAVFSFAIYRGLEQRHERIGEQMQEHPEEFRRSTEAEPGQRSGIQTPFNPEDLADRRIQETFRRTGSPSGAAEAPLPQFMQSTPSWIPDGLQQRPMGQINLSNPPSLGLQQRPMGIHQPMQPPVMVTG